MSRELQLLGELIIQKKEEIAKEVHQARMSETSMSEQEQQQIMPVIQHIMQLRVSFVQLIGETLIHHEDKGFVSERILKWGNEKGEYCFKIGAPLQDALNDTSFYRKIIWKVIEEEAIHQNLSAPAIFKVIGIVDPIIDQSVYYLSLSYVGSYQKSIEDAKNTYIKLSVPVIPLSEGAGVLPLVGLLDGDRARLLMEESLAQAVNLQLTQLILDLSGVPTIDQMAAQQILQVLEALQLIGVKTLLTGIRPEVSMTMVSMGLDTGKLMISRNLEHAINQMKIY